MANKMLIERVDDLEGCVECALEAMADMRLLLADTMRLLDVKLPQYDKMLTDRKLILSKAKAMRLAKRKKRQVIAGREEGKKHAR
jgi:hypothetical protein